MRGSQTRRSVRCRRRCHNCRLEAAAIHAGFAGRILTYRTLYRFPLCRCHTRTGGDRQHSDSYSDLHLCIAQAPLPQVNHQFSMQVPRSHRSEQCTYHLPKWQWADARFAAAVSRTECRIVHFVPSCAQFSMNEEVEAEEAEELAGEGDTAFSHPNGHRYCLVAEAIVTAVPRGEYSDQWQDCGCYPEANVAKLGSTVLPKAKFVGRPKR